MRNVPVLVAGAILTTGNLLINIFRIAVFSGDTMEESDPAVEMLCINERESPNIVKGRYQSIINSNEEDTITDTIMAEHFILGSKQTGIDTEENEDTTLPQGAITFSLNLSK